MKRRILVDGLSPDMGGIGTILLNLVSRLDRERFDVDFLVTYPSVYEEQVQAMGCDIVRVPPFRRYFAYRRGLKRLFAARKYDIVWVNNTGKVNLLIFRLAKKHGAKTISHSHGVASEGSRFKQLLIRIIETFTERSFYRYLDVACACSEASANYFYNPKYWPHPVHIVRNAIEARKFSFDERVRAEVRRELKLSAETLALATVGRLTEVKNQRFLLPVLAECRQQGRDVVLFLVGEGELREDLLAETRSLGLADAVFFLGNRGDVSRLMQGFDLFLLPSLHEGLPLVLIEAQAADLPCLVSNGVTAEVNLFGGVTFLPLSAPEWVQGILAFAAKPRRDVSAQMQKSGFDIEQSAKDFQDVIGN